jgi:nucleoside-diphosphate-sugar epimerase
VTTVVVTGAAGRVGRRVLALLAEAPDVNRVVALDGATVPVVDPKIERHRVDVRRADAGLLLQGADALIHLAFADGDGERARGRRGVAGDATALLLAAATAAGIQHVVALSSALVYGAWPNNPLPLTEDAPLRPSADLPYAVERARAELLLASWAADDPERVVAVLRPCTALAPDGSSWMARSLAAATGLRSLEEEPPRQFLHLDDLATAVELVRRTRLDGPCNVAPDGWIPGDVVRDLGGVAPRPAMPLRLGRLLARIRWRFQRGPIPPGLVPYTAYPWLVANDRLKAAGWRPRYTNEQAYVAGTEARWWTMLSPKRKQELALGGAAVGVVGLGAGIALLVQRLVRRARRS